jgi:ABC-2 type transport system ATP-binding protein
LSNLSHSTEAFAVKTSGLVKRFGRQVALRGVDMLVPDGAVYVLIGANGAGKSTAMRLLMNLERATAGTAQVFGLDTAERGPEVRAQVGYVPEHHRNAYGWMKCAELIHYVASYYPTWDAEYASRMIATFGLELEQKVSTLSKGESRRLQLALALAHRPPLLLLDEPTDGLDPVVRNRTLTLLAEHLADSPTTVLISTHHVHEMESLADHIGVLRDGQLVAQMPRTDLQRTVRRYRMETPEGWQVPVELNTSALRRSSGGREAECTLVGEESEVTQRIVQSGAQVRDITSLSLEDATLAFLSDEVLQ